MNLWNYIFKNQGLPKWIVYLNYASLSAIFVWPLVFFCSIFMFDNPDNVNMTYFGFILINCYPILLILLSYLSFRIFYLSKVVSAVLPTITLLVYIYMGVNYLVPALG